MGPLNWMIGPEDRVSSINWRKRNERERRKCGEGDSLDSSSSVVRRFSAFRAGKETDENLLSASNVYEKNTIEEETRFASRNYYFDRVYYEIISKRFCIMFVCKMFPPCDSLFQFLQFRIKKESVYKFSHSSKTICKIFRVTI